MVERALKPGWKVWRFDQIAVNVADRVEPGDVDVDYYVGLEHLDSDSLKIRRWGEPTDVEATKLLFRKGDIIFGRRRVYQRKLAVAEFDGICSAHAMVLRPRPDVVLPEFLPFFMQSDLFMNRALEISVGSLSPTINWRTLARQEFALPPLAEQRKLVRLGQALGRTIEAKRQLADTSMMLFRSAIDAAFYGLYGPSTILSRYQTKLGSFPRSWKLRKLSDVTSKIVDGVHKRPNYVEEGIPFLTVENLTRGPGIDFADTRYITEEDHSEYVKRADPEYGDVLVSKDGTLGVARVIETQRKFSIFVSVALLKPVRELLDPHFLRYYFDSSIFLRRLASKSSGSALKHIHLVDFRGTFIPLPSIAEQHELVAAIRPIEQSHISALRVELQARQLSRRIFNRALGNGI